MKKNILFGLLALILVIGGFSLYFLNREKNVSPNENLGAMVAAPGTSTAVPSRATALIAPSLSVTSPTGTGVYSGGQTINVVWKTTNIPATDNTVNVYLGMYTSGTLATYAQVASNVPNNGQTRIFLPTTLPSVPGATFGKNFKTLVTVSDSNNTIVVSGASDLFTINPPVASLNTGAGRTLMAESCKGLVGCAGTLLWKLLGAPHGSQGVSSGAIQNIINFIGGLFGGNSSSDYNAYQ